MTETTRDPALRLVAKSREVKLIYREDGLFIFALPRGADTVRIVSRSGVPTDTQSSVADPRCLGVRVKRLVLRSTNEVRDIPVDHPALDDGWWKVEHYGDMLRRWTKGDAALPLPVLYGPALLEIEIDGVVEYLNIASGA